MDQLTIKPIGRFRDGRLVYRVPGNTPPLGYIAFGIIDRGTNVVQARPTTICPQNCIFCSVDAGLKSTNRWAEYIVEPELVVRGVKAAIEEKGCDIEVLIDTVGDALTYPYLVELVKALKNISGVRSVAIETHGLLSSKRLVDKLSEVGLDRINLSIETLNTEKAKYLYGTPAYEVNRVMEVAEYAVKETPIDLHVTPLWLPGINDKDLLDIIKWAIRIGAGKKWPPVTVQKFIKHKYGRGRGLRSVSWREFWEFVEQLEKRLGLRLRWSMEEWGMNYAKRMKRVLKKGDLACVKLIARGWLKGEFLGLYEDKALVTVIPTRGVKLSLGRYYLVEVVSDKDGLYIVKALRSTEFWVKGCNGSMKSAGGGI